MIHNDYSRATTTIYAFLIGMLLGIVLVGCNNRFQASSVNAQDDQLDRIEQLCLDILDEVDDIEDDFDDLRDQGVTLQAQMDLVPDQMAEALTSQEFLDAVREVVDDECD